MNLGWFVRHPEPLLMQRRRYLMHYVNEDEPSRVNHFALLNDRSWHKADIKDYSIGCRVSGMEAPDEAACICGVKWRRKPGVAGCRAINSATLPPALISLNPLTAIKKLK